ncbi:MAG: DUF1214 domain-containing protein [Myxococcota bacterium]
MSGREDARSRLAFHDLLATLAEIDRDHLAAARGLRDPADVASGIRFLLHLLGGGLDLALESDPARPVFRPTLSAGRRFYGDNPDAIYQSTTIDPTRAWRIRSNLQGAVYTSYTVEGGGSLDERYPPGRVVASLNDTAFGLPSDGPPARAADGSTPSDGSYELVASVDPAAAAAAGRPWLPLAPDACSIVTRHYFEGVEPVDRRLSIPIEIEALDPADVRTEREASGGAEPLAPVFARDDAAVARGIRRVANFVRGLSLDYGKNGPAIDFASREPNRFGPPSGWSGEPGQGPVDQSNLWAPFALGDDEALVLEGRFPRCRFANLVVWNRHLQTLGRPGTRCSLNRRQTRLEPDGRFRIVVAARDPGLPNWLDTAGEREGVVFVRYLLPEERPEGIEARVVKIGSGG